MQHSSHIINNLKNVNKALIERTIYTQKMFGIWTILTNLLGFRLATEILSWKWAWKHEEFVNSLSIEELMQIINKDYGYEYLKNNLLGTMKNEMIMTNDNQSIPQSIIDVIDVQN
ncbi:hypothetical protein [Paenibacillus sp. YN15]|uniref:hypothetical protein n=1 Tax=Paenibacillus sp. YN15 TaxID=1742774 RepID=UPI000DCD841C|nr:hypothetical protein [Paenibacillus sp. YN15]RAU90828.1 hypothetical protein DQG13_30210 [Paenibacillus sp. YN15]